MTPAPAELIARMVKRSTAASGVPERLEDPVVARQVAIFLGAVDRSTSSRRARAA